MENSDDFHRWAKDAGNKLRAYVLSYASGATAVFFVALTGREVVLFSAWDKALLSVALLLYVATSAICLLELHVDARRFFNIAKQLEVSPTQQDWTQNARYKKIRLRLLYSSYVTATLATAAVLVFLVMRIV